MSCVVVEEKTVLSRPRPAVQTLLQFADDVRKIRECALFGLEHIHTLDRIPEPAFFLEVQPIALIVALDQHPEETEQELQILLGWFKRERIDREVARLLANIQIRSAEDMRQRLKAATDIEDVGLWLILLRVLQEEIAQIRFYLSRSFRGSECARLRLCADSGSRAWCCRFRATARYSAPRCAFVFSPGRIVKRKRQVGIVSVEQIQLAKIQRIVAGHRCEIGIELVVGLGEQIAIRIGEDAGEFSDQPVDLCLVAIVDNDR